MSVGTTSPICIILGKQVERTLSRERQPKGGSTFNIMEKSFDSLKVIISGNMHVLTNCVYDMRQIWASEVLKALTKER